MNHYHDTHIITNAERAERALRALESYNDEYDVIGNAIDFLADLQHYCAMACHFDANHRTFDDLLQMAGEHFAAEIGGAL